MEKNPCYDDCPIFKLTLYENGLIRYEGEDFVDKIGVYTKKMNINDLRKLTKQFRDAGFHTFDDAYRSDYPDQQTISITFDDEGTTKTIIGKADGRPEEIMAAGSTAR